MSEAIKNLREREDGSLALTLLATIVVAGLVSVLLARTVAGERAVRFDRDFSEAVHTADVGINRGLFALNEGLVPDGATSWPSTAPLPTTVDGVAYDWSVSQTGSRHWEITSRSTTASGVSRLLVALAEEEPLFFPGAFGDRFIGLNGTSSKLDSYNSDPNCTSACWGRNDAFGNKFGTGNGAIGTNLQLELDGGTQMPPGSGFLYDWEDNPGIGDAYPFGDRLIDGQYAQSCIGVNRCTTEYVSTVDRRHEGMSNERIKFIYDKFATGGPCTDTTSSRWINDPIGKHQKDPAHVFRSYSSVSNTTSLSTDPTSSDFTNFYCAENLDFNSDAVLHESVTPDNPVVIFVKNRLKVVNPHRSIACHGRATVSASNCDADAFPDTASARQVRPRAARLQVYVAGLGPDNVFMSNSEFAGVVFAPKSDCFNSGGAHFFGAMLCERVDHEGGWSFHYDDALGTYGTGVFNIASWQERSP